MYFTVKERNELAEIIINNGLKTTDFHESNSTKYNMVFRPLALSFGIIDNPNSHLWPGIYSIGTIPNRIEGSAYNYKNGTNWKGTVAVFRKWVSLIVDELQTPDLWKLVQEREPFLKSATNLPNEVFSTEEIKVLVERVETVENKIKELKLPAEAQAAITEIVRDVPVEAKFFTKKKLTEIVVGQLISQGLKWGLTTEHMQAIWHAFQSFGQLLIG